MQLNGRFLTLRLRVWRGVAVQTEGPGTYLPDTRVQGEEVPAMPLQFFILTGAQTAKAILLSWFSRVVTKSNNRWR